MMSLHGLRSGTAKGAQPERDKSLAAWSGGYLAAAAVLLALALASIAAIDWLAAGVSGEVNTHRVSWWGAHEESYWSNAVASPHGLRLTSRDLLIKISGDSLTAQYTVTAPAGSVLATRASASEDGNSGDDLVSNVLGAVRVAEFRYGFTGSHHSFNSLYVPCSASVRNWADSSRHRRIGPGQAVFHPPVHLGGQALRPDRGRVGPDSHKRHVGPGHGRLGSGGAGRPDR
jgi:hypothetical protein